MADTWAAAAAVTMGTTLLVNSQATIVHAAALEETAKNTGTKVITFDSSNSGLELLVLL